MLLILFQLMYMLKYKDYSNDYDYITDDYSDCSMCGKESKNMRVESGTGKKFCSSCWQEWNS
jgi:hypothetical protein